MGICGHRELRAVSLRGGRGTAKRLQGASRTRGFRLMSDRHFSCRHKPKPLRPGASLDSAMSLSS